MFENIFFIQGIKWYTNVYKVLNERTKKNTFKIGKLKRGEGIFCLTHTKTSPESGNGSEEDCKFQ